MAKNYKHYDYFANRPDVVKVFEDLEAFLDFCRFELLPYDPASMYNKNNYAWRAFDKSRNFKKAQLADRKGQTPKSRKHSA